MHTVPTIYTPLDIASLSQFVCLNDEANILLEIGSEYTVFVLLCTTMLSNVRQVNEAQVVWFRLINLEVIKSLLFKMIIEHTLQVFKTLYFIWCFKIKHG